MSDCLWINRVWAQPDNPSYTQKIERVFTGVDKPRQNAVHRGRNLREISLAVYPNIWRLSQLATQIYGFQSVIPVIHAPTDTAE